MPRGVAERRLREGVQSLPGRHAAADTAAAHEPGLFADSDKTLARFKARDTTVVDVHEET